MAGPPAFRDATSDPPSRTHFPDTVAGFEELGFRQIGRLERVLPGGVDQAAGVYLEEHRALFREHKSVPMSVLTSQDGRALVLIDWFWGMPDVRMRTTMSNGSVVETRRAFSNPPVLPTVLERGRRHLNMAEERVLSSVPAGGRTIAVAAGNPPDLWAVHQRRIESWAREHGTSPMVFRGMEQAIELSRRLAAHDLRVIRRVIRIQRASVVALLLPSVLILCRTWLGDELTWTEATAFLFILLLNLMVGLAVILRLLPRVRYARRLSPPFVS